MQQSISLKKILLTAAGFLLIKNSIAQTELLTLSENKLNGPVKSVTTRAHWMKEKFGELEPEGFYFSEYCAFNKDGLLTTSSRTENYDYKNDYTFKYDRNKRLTVQKQVFGKEKSKGQYSWKYTYDDLGRQTEINMYGDKDEMFWKHKMKYREDGKISESFYYDADGRLTMRLEYVYNQNNQLYNTITYDRNDKVTAKISSEYDKDGNKITELKTENQGQKEIMTVMKWKYSDGKMIYEGKVVYDPKERLYVLEFDKWGNVIRKMEPPGTMITTVYTFDSNNNWITAMTSWKGSDGPVTYRKVREISYY